MPSRQRNSFRDTNHYIIFGFFGVASSLFLMLQGDVSTLAGVYNIAFLSVMSLFATACMLLKWKRPGMPRAVRTTWFQVRHHPRSLARTFVCVGLFVWVGGLDGWGGHAFFFLRM